VAVNNAKRWLSRAIAPLVLAGTACTGSAPPRPTPAPRDVRTKTFDLGPLRIDRIFRSMEGPSIRQRLDFSEMDWVTGLRSEVQDAATGEPMPDEFFCHSQMQLDTETRLLVTATGISAIRFPDGFGIPLKRILAGMPEKWRGVTLLGMVLNNHDATMNRQVSVRLAVEYLSFPDPNMKTLYKAGLPMTREPEPGGEHHHHLAGGQDDEEEGLVGGMPQHWIVPPGRQVTRRELADVVPVDGTVHFAAVHLHNYGVYMRLTDRTAGKVLWQTDVVNEPTRVQIARIPAYSSATGFPIYRDHLYEIETLYDNTSAEPVDAMAMMYLFFHPAGNEEISYAPPLAEGG